MKISGNFRTTLGNLQSQRYIYIADSLGIKDILESIGREDLIDRAKGACVDVKDGEFIEVWISEYSAPYLLSNPYELIYQQGG